MTSQESGKRRQSRVHAAAVRSLDEERPGDEVLTELSPAERLALVAELSERMWELTGRPLPDYSRAEMPVRVLHPE